MGIIRRIIAFFLWLIALGLAALTLGTFANLNPNSPLLLRSVGSIAGIVPQQLGLGGVPGFYLALGYCVLTSLVVGFATWLKPRQAAQVVTYFP